MPVPFSLPAIRLSPLSSSSLRAAGLPVCRDFQFGRCNRGAACRFEHVGGGGGGGGGYREPPRGGPPPGGGNNGACFDFLKGRCFRRDCKFVHDDQAQIEVRGIAGCSIGRGASTGRGVSSYSYSSYSGARRELDACVMRWLVKPSRRGGLAAPRR